MIGVFDLAKMFEEVYGYKTSAYDFPKEVPENRIADLGSPLYGKDSFGREYYMPIKVGDYDLPFPVVSIRRSKTIIDTPMIERNGSVQELVSLEDWQITIRGLILSQDGNFPEEQLKALATFEKRNESLQMRCALTDVFLEGSQKVNLRYFDLPEIVGSRGQRPYTFEFKSDLELELEVKPSGQEINGTQKDLSSFA